MGESEVKMIIVGDSGVGKTSLARRAVDNVFTFEQPTVGTGTFVYDVDSEKNGRVRFTIWDTAGQEQFQAMLPLYFSNAAVALLVFDLTSKASFDHIEQWFDRVVSKAPSDIVIVVVGNKLDLTSNREVPTTSGLDFQAQKGIAHYAEVSAATGENVVELFKQIADIETLRRDYRKATLSLTTQPVVGCAVPQKQCC